MRITARWAQRSAGALVALIIAAGLIAALGGRAQAQIDISGTWDVTLSGDRSNTCISTYEQDGSVLHTETVCDGYAGAFDGTIDPSTGNFSLSGSLDNYYQVEVVGTASPDGNSMSGTWSEATESLSGAFVGTRRSEPEPPCSILDPAACPQPEMPTATPPPGTPPTTAEPSPAALALPETGASRPASSVSLLSVLLLAGGGAALVLGGLVLRRRLSISQ